MLECMNLEKNAWVGKCGDLQREAGWTDVAGVDWSERTEKSRLVGNPWGPGDHREIQEDATPGGKERKVNLRLGEGSRYGRD